MQGCEFASEQDKEAMEMSHLEDRDDRDTAIENLVLSFF